MNIQSILLVNDYCSLCSLTDRKCRKSLLARKYLNYKITKLLQSKGQSRKSKFLYMFLGLLFIR